MRLTAGWHDACILNLSSRGMMVQSEMPPQPGSYLEIRRGSQVIVARVVWMQARRFGVRTQDPLNCAALLREPTDSSTPERVLRTDAGDRRSESRSRASPHEQSRWRGRAIEFASVAVLGALAAMLGLGAVSEALARPLSQVLTALRPD